MSMEYLAVHADEVFLGYLYFIAIQIFGYSIWYVRESTSQKNLDRAFENHYTVLKNCTMKLK